MLCSPSVPGIRIPDFGQDYTWVVEQPVVIDVPLHTTEANVVRELSFKYATATSFNGVAPTMYTVPG